ncbi:MAG: sulfatase-like hydrolase/transferase [Bryobacteraceae bacterium]|nr:sulfatase-like hydrolase/transferase [Bryobacteraceae bacterium]
MNWTRRSMLVLPAAALAQRPAAPPARPSIVLILARDLPAWALGCYGNKEIRTPNLDELARAGTRFNNCLAYAPVPEPGRTALLTGSPQGGRSLSDRLGAAGYRCGSFEETAAAVAFAGQQKPGQPFFLTLQLPGAGGPHDSHMSVYANMSFEHQGIMQGAPNAAHGKERLEDVNASFRQAAAAISALDAQLPPLRRTLMERGFFDNTLLIFTSTNGMLLGRHGLWSDARASEPPNLFEEVVQTPMIWSWPGRVPVQAARPELVSSLDFVPTLCDAAGIEGPEGRSYLALATSRALPKGESWRDLAFANHGDVWMARDNRFKLILRENAPSVSELYDLRQDPREFKNGFDDPRYLTVKERLSRELDAWREKPASRIGALRHRMMG